MNNPLLNKFETVFESIPFKQIKQEDFEPAILEGIALAKAEIKKITDNTEEPSFENTIVALERSGKVLNVASTTLGNLCSAETNDFLEEIQEKTAPLLAGFGNDVSLNEALFQRINVVFDKIDKKLLSREAWQLLDKTYKSFTRNGALLSDEGKEKLRKIDQELSVLTVKFSQNVLKETNAFSLNISDESKLEGLPDSIKIQAKAEAEGRNQEGWVFTLQYPSYVPFMKFIKDRELRREMYLANGRKAFQGNEFNNKKNIQRIVELRQNRAELLGFGSHADFVLAERMAGNTNTVNDFLQDLLQKAKPFGIKDIESLKPLAAEDGIDELMPFDHAYYAEKLREEKYDFSEESLRPYFPLNQVLVAAFKAAGRLYDLQFVERNDVPTYHDEVSVYEVLEHGKHKALFYADFHPRKGKRSGAWMTDFKGQYQDEQGNHRPHISIVCNFSKATGKIPSLLTFQEVTTLFHEFGHSLHGMLADTVFESLSGTHVYWDFVELPSQFMENYCYQKEFLKDFAKHYETGEVLPEAQIDKIVASANFMEGYQTLRQLSFSMLDMAFHTGKLTDNLSIEQFEEEVMKETQLYPKISGTAMSPSFSHIFSGGYSAGYYSYKWSEVLDADAFSLFKETGIFNHDTAEKFKTLLSKGGTENPMDLYVAFRGRKPHVEALLERAGLK